MKERERQIQSDARIIMIKMGKERGTKSKKHCGRKIFKVREGERLDQPIDREREGEREREIKNDSEIEAERGK